MSAHGRTWTPELIPHGTAAHTGGGEWTYKCTTCTALFATTWGAAYLHRIPEAVAHELEHGTAIPGINTPMLA